MCKTIVQNICATYWFKLLVKHICEILNSCANVSLRYWCKIKVQRCVPKLRLREICWRRELDWAQGTLVVCLLILVNRYWCKIFVQNIGLENWFKIFVKNNSSTYFCKIIIQNTSAKNCIWEKVVEGRNLIGHEVLWWFAC